MVVREMKPGGFYSKAEHVCLLQDTNHLSAGNKINSQLKKGDKVYKILNEKNEVVMLIGCGKKHNHKEEQRKEESIVSALIRAFSGFVGLAIIILGIQFIITGGYYLFECIFIYKEFVDFKCTGLITIFGWVQDFKTYMFIGLLLPGLYLGLMLLLIPIMGTYIVDLLGPKRIRNKDRKK